MTNGRDSRGRSCFAIWFVVRKGHVCQKSVRKWMIADLRDAEEDNLLDGAILTYGAIDLLCLWSQVVLSSPGVSG